MANNYTFAANSNTYVPTLHADLIVEFSRNPAAFPINRYTDVRKVDKEVGYYVQMLNNVQGMYVNDADVVWADGNDRPVLTYGNGEHEFLQYYCKRRDYGQRHGYLAIEQAGWDILDQSARYLAQMGMTHRSKRIHNTLTTGANWAGFTSTATALGGGTFANGTSTNPYIRNSLLAATISIVKNTFGLVQPKDLFLVINPNTAKEIVTAGEFIDYLKQSPVAWETLKNEGELASRYGLPAVLMGLNVVVDDTVYNSAVPGATPSFSFTFPDTTALIMSKKQAIAGTTGTSFSTFTLFAYSEFQTEVFNDPINRRYDLHVSEAVDDSFVFAPQSGYLITST